MANLAIFKPQKFSKKKSEANYLFTFELKESKSSRGYKKFLSKPIIYNKKTTPTIKIPFSSKVGTKNNCNSMKQFSF